MNTNGLISFLVAVSQYTPDRFPLGNNRLLIAPFWADIDTTSEGKVFYRQTTDPGLLQKASNDIKTIYGKCRNFRAIWLFIATWYEVPFFGASGVYKTKVRNDLTSAV